MKIVAQRRQQGFTLIELLAAIGIMALIVLFMGRIFTDATTAWNLGTKRVHEAQEGRVIIDFLSQELSQAIGDDLVSFRVHSQPGGQSFGVPAFGMSHSVCFIAPTQTPPSGDMKRAAPHFTYYLAPMEEEVDGDATIIPHRYRLVREQKMGVTHTDIANSAHRNPEWWAVGGATRRVVAENVTGFEVHAWSRSANNYVNNFDSIQEGELPLWVDIYLELLDEVTSQQVAALMTSEPARAVEMLERNARRYGARIHFKSREGYAP